MAALRLATAAVAALTAANAVVYEVSPVGTPMTLTEALDVAGPGDTISLGDGVYREPIVTQRAGEEGSPIVIEGGRGAVVNYFSGDKLLMWSQKVVDIRHSWITLRGFTVDGHLDDKEEENSFVDKCIWIEGQGAPTMMSYGGKEVESAIIGTVIEGMKIRNCGMECIRMRNWVTNSVIKGNDIEDCGIYDFRFQFDSVIGEAVYIGTSSNQWTGGPTDSTYQQFARDGGPGGMPDGCNYNLVIANTINTRGNECVDIKEGATMNVVEDNDCFNQMDPESGCYDSRGNGNIFRSNRADGCAGAGIRLGGHVIDGFVYGVDNDVYGNDFKNADFGAIKSRQHPQGIICGNTCSLGSCRIDEAGEDEEISATWDQECPSSFPAVPFIDDMETGAPAPGPKETTPPATPAPGFEALGCVKDASGTGRVMSHMKKDNKLTHESCAINCDGYAYFGVQWGVECWCGSSETEHLKNGESKMCDFECAGDADETCGGKWAMNVFKYTSGGGSGGDGGDGGGDGSATCDGLPSDLGFYCCASSCGKCGGTGCSSRPGGSSACCTSKIEKAGVTCESTGGVAPCIM